MCLGLYTTVNIPMPPGYPGKIKALTKSEKNYLLVIKLLWNRVNKLGHISLKEAWLLLREEIPFSYDVLRIHFNRLMGEIINEGRAEKIDNGSFWIYRQRIS